MMSQHLVSGLLVIFIALSVVAMFTTSRVGDEMNWIGMNVKRISAETRTARGIPENVGGVLVESTGGIAQRAGIREGDIIVGINGSGVRDLYDFSHFTGETDISKGGAQIDLIRNGMRMPVFVFPSDATARVPVQGMPVPAAGAAAAAIAVSPQWLGIEGDTVRGADTLELGLPAGAQGVLIDGVAVGSRAQQAGLARRDVIVAVNGQRISSARGLWNALGGVNGGDTVELGIYRGGQLLSVVVPSAMTAGAAAGAPAAAPAGAPAVVPAAMPVPAGRMGGAGLGPGGLLVCPNCGTKIAHQRAVPCFTVPCPSCGTMMTRAQ
jgi:S1-C subfamily serine protease